MMVRMAVGVPAVATMAMTVHVGSDDNAANGLRMEDVIWMRSVYTE
jgi:hypothetical protein